MAKGSYSSGVHRERVYLTVSSQALAWVRANCRPGGPFLYDSQAIEIALSRLRDEQDFIRDACKRENTTYSGSAFWNLHEHFLEKATPTPGFRPTRHQAKLLTERERCFASLDRTLLQWVDQACKPRGPFENLSHACETALLHLQALQPSDGVAGVGFPFNGPEVWRAYQDQLAAKLKRPT